jgi:hypothetical protein
VNSREENKVDHKDFLDMMFKLRKKGQDVNDDKAALREYLHLLPDQKISVVAISVQ